MRRETNTPHINNRESVANPVNRTSNKRIIGKIEIPIVSIPNNMRNNNCLRIFLLKL